VIKIKASAQSPCLPAPAGVLEGSRADVSVAELTPRPWKQHFAANLLRSDIRKFSI
jgi:hypothetical protein